MVPEVRQHDTAPAGEGRMMKVIVRCVALGWLGALLWLPHPGLALGWVW